MLQRLRARVRQKVARVVDDVVAARTDSLRTELTATFQRQLDAARADIVQATKQYEIRQRRDVFFAGEVRAVAETAQFVEATLRDARAFPHPHETLKYALELVTQPGLVLEFGVASGTTLRLITAGLPGHQVVGFDVFTGLPESWRPGFPAGAFAQENLPEVPGAELVVGLFGDTLPGFLETHAGPAAFLHLDADLYSATRDVLALLRERIVPGTVILFDEYFNYPGWQNGEHLAWTEFVAATGTPFTYRGYTFDHEQVVVVVEEQPS